MIEIGITLKHFAPKQFLVTSVISYLTASFNENILTFSLVFRKALLQYNCTQTLGVFLNLQTISGKSKRTTHVVSDSLVYLFMDQRLFLLCPDVFLVQGIVIDSFKANVQKFISTFSIAPYIRYFVIVKVTNLCFSCSFSNYF